MKKTIQNFEKIDAILIEVFENAKLENLNKIDEDTYTEIVNQAIPKLENLGYDVPKDFAFLMMYDANDYNIAKSMNEGMLFLNRFNHDLRFDYEHRNYDIFNTREIKELSNLYLKATIYQETHQISANKFDEVSSQIKKRLKKLGYKVSPNSEKQICDLAENILSKLVFYTAYDKDKLTIFKLALDKINNYDNEIKAIFKKNYSRDISR